MGYPTPDDVRQKLGDNYQTEPSDPVIESFINRRIAQVEERTGHAWTEPPESVFLWVLNQTCADILQREIIDSQASSPLSYKIGDEAVDKAKNIDAKLKAIQLLRDEAEQALMQYLTKTTITFVRGAP